MHGNCLLPCSKNFSSICNAGHDKLHSSRERKCDVCSGEYILRELEGKPGSLNTTNVQLVVKGHGSELRLCVLMKWL